MKHLKYLGTGLSLILGTILAVALITVIPFILGYLFTTYVIPSSIVLGSSIILTGAYCCGIKFYEN